MDMFIESDAPPNTPLVPVQYELLEPTELIIEEIDGRRTLTGCGIGEKFWVMEPKIINLVCTYEPKIVIHLADGRKIVNWPRQIKNRRVI